MKQQEVYSGLDVHKDSVFAAIYSSRVQAVKEFTTLTPSIQDLIAWLRTEGVKKVAMESTGIYWVPVWNLLESAGFQLMLVNPYMIKQMPGRKSDVKDALWIAQLLAKKLLRGSLVPSLEIRSLRYYSREYVKKQGAITRVMQSIERTLEMANIRITRVTSRIESKSVLNIVKAIIEGCTDIEMLLQKIHGRIKNSKGQMVRDALIGQVQEEHRFLLKLKLEEYELLSRQSEQLHEKMLELAQKNFKQEFELVQTMPGVGEQAAIQLIAETGADMTAFSTSNKITKWAGLCPRNDESAGKIKSKATLKGNPYLRRILVQIAWASSRMKGSHFHAAFNHLAIRKGRKKALVAIARKQLTVLWNMWSSKLPYDPDKQPVYSKDQLVAKKKYYEKELNKINLFLD